MNIIPTEKDINPFGDLDAAWAVKSFLGKDVEQILALFRKEGEIYSYIEDLGWMGSYAFSYYFQAVIKYYYEELEKNSNVAAHMGDLIALVRLKKIVASESIKLKDSQITQIMIIAISKLKTTIKEIDDIPMQQFYEKSWGAQRKMHKIKEECMDCINLLQPYIKKTST